MATGNELVTFDMLKYMKGKLGTIDFGWESGKINLDTDGSEATGDNFLRSSFIPTKGLSKWKLVINGTLATENRINTVWYAADKTYIRRGPSFTETTDGITAPFGAEFIRFVIKKEVVDLVKLIPNTEERLEDAEERLNALESIDFGWESGTLNLNGDGSEAENNNYVRSSFISTEDISKWKLVINGTLTERINTALYREDKTYYARGGSYSETTDNLSVSNNAKFIRFVIQAKDANLVKLDPKTEERLEGVEGRLEDVESVISDVSTASLNVEERLEGVESVISDVSVASLNRDKEHLLYSAWQSCAPRLRGGSVDDPPGTALGFIHFSDVHGTLISWKRLGAYLDHFSDLFSFALHTGDYVPSNQGNYNPTAGNMYQRVATEKPILNCVGNHDTLLSDGVTKNPDSSAARNILFADIENWGVTRPSDDVMYYYKDFGDVRLIVLDQYYTDATETAWLTDLLADARTNGKSVITASHTQTAPITRNISTFNDIDRPSSALNETNGFESVIKAFKDAGGTHICHLGGHWHWDVVGFTDNGILNILVECATIYGGGYRNDVRRYGDKAEGQSRAYDCFNAVFVDTFTHTIRIIRIGSNTDNYLHPKNTLCIDYAAGTLIANG